MKIAVIADIHIPDCNGSSEQAALEWAVQMCRTIAADVVVCAGDLTASGRTGELERFLRTVGHVNCPLVLTPGNSDVRTPRSARYVREALSIPSVQHVADGIAILALDTSAGSVPAEERTRFENETTAAVRAGDGIVVVTHYPPADLPGADRDWFAAIAATGSLELVVVGHKHLDAVTNLADVPVHLVRGLDPEKAKNAPPALAIFTRSGKGDWRREDLSWAECDPRTWSDGERRAVLEDLGISTMSRTLEDARAAAALCVPVLELRAGPAAKVSRRDLVDAVRAWRKNGGRDLSIHLPDLRWDADRGAVTGRCPMREAVAMALELGVQRATVHVPRASVAEMTDGGPVGGAMLSAVAEDLKPLSKAGVVLGVENLHLSGRDPSDKRRRFGCTPPECRTWMQALAMALPETRVGILLDIGHARNNAPLSQVWTLGRWLAEVGPEAVGYHVHQVTGKGNHQPLDGVFGPTVSLAALFWGWRTGGIAHAPMFLEIRDESALMSLATIRRFLA